MLCYVAKRIKVEDRFKVPTQLILKLGDYLELSGWSDVSTGVLKSESGR